MSGPSISPFLLVGGGSILLVVFAVCTHMAGVAGVACTDSDDAAVQVHPKETLG